MAFHQPETPELTPQALVKWLRTQNPKDTYLYQDPARCLLGYYFANQDCSEAVSETAYEQFPDYKAIAEPKPHTFGAALDRAEQLLALPPPDPIDRDFAIEEVPENKATPSEITG